MVKLSIVSRGRNDNYGNLYKEKVQFNINKHISNFIRLGLTPNDIELVFTDWGSNNIPLYTELIDLKKNNFIKFIIVSNDVTNLYDPEETKFSFVHSTNTAIRRSIGNFIFHIDFDVFFPYKSFENLWKYVIQYNQNNNFHNYFNRLNVFGWESILKNNVDIYEMDDLEKIPETKPNMNYFEGCSAGHLYHRDIWWEVGGYDERMIYWGFQDTDLFLRVNKAKYIPNILENVITYHFEHKRVMCPKSNNPFFMTRNPISINPNGENWGLNQYKFEEVII